MRLWKGVNCRRCFTFCSQGGNFLNVLETLASTHDEDLANLNQEAAQHLPPPSLMTHGQLTRLRPAAQKLLHDIATFEVDTDEDVAALIRGDTQHLQRRPQPGHAQYAPTQQPNGPQDNRPSASAAAGNANPYPCPHCQRSYTTPGGLDAHIQAVHSGVGGPLSATPRPPVQAPLPTPASPPTSASSSPTGMSPVNPYPCPQCLRSFQTAEALAAHQLTAHGVAPPGRVVCPVPGCLRQFDSQSALEAHQHTAHGVAPSGRVACPAPGCLRQFDSAAALAQHLEQSHPGFTFTTQLQQQQQQQQARPLVQVPMQPTAPSHSAHSMGAHPSHTAHSVAPPGYLACPVPGCMCLFDSAVALGQHLLDSHRDFRTGGHQQATRPLAASPSQQPQAWPPAQAEAAQPASSSGSAVNAVVNRYPCPQCLRSFATAEGLAHHQHTTHGVVPPGRVVCPAPGCMRQFDSMAALAQHLENSHPGFLL